MECDNREHLNENIPKWIHADKKKAIDVPPGYLFLC
jgi:hypothetical protein